MCAPPTSNPVDAKVLGELLKPLASSGSCQSEATLIEEIAGTEMVGGAPQERKVTGTEQSSASGGNGTSGQPLPDDQAEALATTTKEDRRRRLSYQIPDA